MLFNCLLFIVLLSPLPFGSNQPWSTELCILLISLLFVIWAMSEFKNNKLKILTHSSIRQTKDVIMVFGFFLGWCIYQSMVPISNNEIQILLGNTSKTEISALTDFKPEVITDSVKRILSYGLVFFMSFYYCQSKEKTKQVFDKLMLAGFIYSLYGLLMYFGGYGLVLWVKNKATLSAVSSTFINPNNFAIFAGLTLLCSLALMSEKIGDVVGKYYRADYMGWPFSIKDIDFRTWFLILIFLTITLALILTFSRCGFFSCLFAIFSFLTVLNLSFRIRHYYTVWIVDTLWLMMIFFAVGFTLFSLTANHIVLPDEISHQISAMTWSAVMERPWLGFGLSRFESLFPLYDNHASLSNLNNVIAGSYSYNSYLGVLFELGIPASLALFYCFSKIAWICFKGICIRKRDWIYSATGLSATFLIATSAFFEINLQVPAIAYTYMLLTGAACAQSFPTRTPKKVIQQADNLVGLESNPKKYINKVELE
jgi:hypothetical protein